MSRSLLTFVPTQQAVNGALDLFVTGSRRSDFLSQRIGLAVLSSATEVQVQSAMDTLQGQRIATVAEIEALLQA
ncbi:MAG TPA: hypothetical protein PKX00_05065 [Opitutaceae bacterium]|jgi:hypothetical protein|nr:hypothetical protein [Opitutaceae bacterium]